jgi:hypothetical protein
MVRYLDNTRENSSTYIAIACRTEGFARTVEALCKAGLDPGARVELLTDYCRIEARIETLREAEASPRGEARLVASRAINTAGAEKRRLYSTLFKGRQKADARTTDCGRPDRRARPVVANR